jgi:hypothetical protein
MRNAVTPASSWRRRMPAWKVRVWIYGSLVAAFVVAMFVAWLVMLRMPGRSFDGTPPPLAADDRAQLELDVRKLGGEIGERSIYLPAKLELAAQYIEQRFASCALVPRRETFDVRGTKTSNVVAEIAGGARRGEIVVVGAHYDSVETSPGANDNATGVAALLALARRFAAAKPERTLRFVAFSAEEPPCFQTEFMGSLVHARGSAARGENVVAMLALETLGCFRDGEDSQQYPVRGLGLFYPTRGNFVAFVGDVGSRALVREALAVFREHASIASEGAALPSPIPGIAWSDHWSFRQIGVPAVMVTDTALFRDPAYHTPNDLPKNVDFDRLARVTLGLVPVIERLVDPPR